MLDRVCYLAVCEKDSFFNSVGEVRCIHLIYKVKLSNRLSDPIV